MAKISLDQLDEFIPTFLATVQDGQLAVWDESQEKFIPVFPHEIEPITYRRIFMLMGA